MILKDNENIFNPTHRSERPRLVGQNHVLDKGLPPRHTSDWIEWIAPHIDGWKFGWTTWLLVDWSGVRQKVELLNSKDIETCLGGTAGEIALANNELGSYLDLAMQLGVCTVELGANRVVDSIDIFIDAIRRVKDAGLRCNFELGFKLETKSTLNAKYWIDLGAAALAAGADKIVLEARESGRGIGIFDNDGEVSTETVIWRQQFPQEKLLVEAPNRGCQISALKFFSNTVNLSNILVDEVLRVETMRRDLHSDFSKR